MFLLREVEGKELGDFGDFTRARRRLRMPVVLSREECARLFEAMEGVPKLMAELVYGSGLRLMELLRLRVKDVDLDRRQVVVRGGKGDKDRVTVLPERLLEKLAAHRERLRRLQVQDRGEALPGVWLPEGLERKWPKAGEAWEWQWFWPSRELMNDPRTGLRRRHHLLDVTFQHFVRRGAQQAQLEQESDAACAASFVCDAFARAGDGHPHGAGTARARGCGDDADLHACDAETGAGGAQPAGSLGKSGV